jgi:GTP-binding protein
VGKSSLLNALLGYERVLVSSVPGTTRDSTDTVLEHNGQKVVLIDTAGIRRRGKIEYGVEKWSVIRSFRAITRADVVLLVIDAMEPLTAQDAHIAGYVEEATKGIMVVVNKWDLVEKTATTADDYLRAIHRDLKFIPYAPALFVSALTKQRVHRIVDECLKIAAERKRRIPTAQLNEVVREAMREHNPPSLGGHQLRLRYLTQAETSPPTFVAFVNDPRLVHFGFERYLQNRLRERFGFSGTAIRLVFRATDEERDRAAAAERRGGGKRARR